MKKYKVTVEFVHESRKGYTVNEKYVGRFSGESKQAIIDAIYMNLFERYNLLEEPVFSKIKSCNCSRTQYMEKVDSIQLEKLKRRNNS